MEPFVIENGVYRLKKHMKNSRPSGHNLWTSCEYIPPRDDPEWGFRDPEEFLFVVQDVFVLGRKYQEIVYAAAEWSSGFYVGDVPCAEHFPGLDAEEVEEELYGALQHRAEGPAPEDFLRALVPVDRSTLTELLLDYAQYEGIDPQNRLFKHRWAETVFAVLDEMGTADPELLKKFETALRMFLIKDANRPAFEHVFNDPEEQKAYEARAAQEAAEIRNKQHEAFSQMHRADMKRKLERDEERRRQWEEEQGTDA